MQRRSIKENERYQVNVRGYVFEATVVGKPPGLIQIMPADPKKVTFRFVPARMVVKKLERQERLLDQTTTKEAA